MKRSGRCVLAALGLLTTTAAAADPPKLTDAAPVGVRRGEAVELTLLGERLGPNPRLIAPFPFELQQLPSDRSKPEAWAFRLTVSEATAAGVYPIRVQTDDGVSPPLLLPVGLLPQITETEDNGRIDAAQTLTPPVVVEGRAAGNDVDCFRFAGRQGERFVVDAQCARIGSGMDPTLRLSQLAPTRRLIATAEDTPGLLTDARVFVELPEDGEYAVELSDARYAGGGRAVYRLLIGGVPVAEEVYPLGGRSGETVGFELHGGAFTEPQMVANRLVSLPHSDRSFPRFRLDGLELEAARPLAVSTYPEVREPIDPAAVPIRVAVPVVLNGRIEARGDEDRYVIAARPGTRLRLRVDAARLGSALDGWLQVLNPKGVAIVTADDQTTPGPIVNGVAAKIVDPDPAATFEVPTDAEEVTLVLRDNERRGGLGYGYRIVVEPATPDFTLTLDATEANIPRGGTRIVGVAVTREGYDGPISLSAPNSPPGVSVQGGRVAAGQLLGRLSLTAPADAAFDVADLEIVGEAQGPMSPIRRSAKVREVYSRLEYVETNVLERQALATAPSTSEPVKLAAPPEPIEVPHGQTASIPVKLTRSEGADAAVELSALPLPPGFTVAVVKTAEKAEAAEIVAAVAPEAALGATSIGLSVKGKFAPGDRIIEGPLVTLNVVRPVDLTLDAADVQIASGATAGLKGKVVRRGTFKEPITIKLEGLPAGLTVGPVTVPPETVEFELKLSADTDAPAAEAVAKVAAVFPVGGKDYPLPPVPLTVKVASPQPK